jgi:cysteine synthase A
LRSYTSELIGRTRLVQLKKIRKSKAQSANCGQAYCMNPSDKVKDRIGASMIEAAKIAGLISPKKTILVEPTGNTGIALFYGGSRTGLPSYSNNT